MRIIISSLFSSLHFLRSIGNLTFSSLSFKYIIYPQIVSSAQCRYLYTYIFTVSPFYLPSPFACTIYQTNYFVLNLYTFFFSKKLMPSLYTWRNFCRLKRQIRGIFCRCFVFLNFIKWNTSLYPCYKSLLDMYAM